MKAPFCIIGATRGTGLLIAQQLLERGSNVTVVVRSQRVQFSSLQALKDYLQCNLCYWSNIR
jgi:short-subunit dehydrogenase